MDTSGTLHDICLSGTKTPGHVDFYFDDKYMGTNNAYVPTRGGRLYVAHWYPASKNNIWNGPANDWEGGKAGLWQAT